MIRTRLPLATSLLSLLMGSLAFAGQQESSRLLVRGGALASEIHLSGTQTLHGAAQRLYMHVSRDFQFKVVAEGELPEQDGFDGKITWHMNGSGIPHSSSYSDRDLTRLVAYVQAGVWSCKGSPVQIVSEHGNDLVIKCSDGKTTANLTLDPTTRTAKTMSCWGPSGTESWTFGNYKNSHGILIPGSVQHESGETKDSVTVTQFDMPIGGEVVYSMPYVQTNGFSFDAKNSPNIEVKRLYGYIFVRPKLDGKDEGWWFLDTGAEVMVIDPEVARAHNMKVVGNDSVSGVVASVKTNFSKGVEFQLGPVTIKNSSYMELDMKPFSEGLGIKLAGICGYDYIGRATLDIDPKKNTIGVYPSGTMTLPDSTSWTPFLFHGNMPSLSCQFEGNHDGLFSLDTGSGSTVDFFSPAVTKYNLLKDREINTVMTGGAGGASESKTGTLDWFIVANKRFQKPTVGFQITTKGGFASPFVDGNIGMGFMSNFRMILDYQKSRLAMIEAKG